MKKYINIKNIKTLIIVFLLFYFNGLFKYIPGAIFNIDFKNISSTTRILLSIFCNLCVLTILLIIYYKDIKEYIKKLKGNVYKVMDSSFKYYLFGLFGMIASNLLINMIIAKGGPNNEKLVQEMITSAPYLMIINAGIIAPIIEELVFRKSFLDVFKNKWLFTLLSGFVFGLMHVITSSDTLIEYLYLIPYASLGISLAYMDYKNDNVLPSIIIHTFHNTLLILLAIAL